MTCSSKINSRKKSPTFKKKSSSTSLIVIGQTRNTKESRENMKTNFT